jgi:siroheme synthase (precorrin-2 oxidase/ferrochelatase)
VLLLEKLEAIVLVGTAARKAHVFLSAKTDVRILSCHHPSPKVKNFSPETTHENVEVMKAMLSYSRRSTQVDS